jgi:hypothetical protein
VLGAWIARNSGGSSSSSLYTKRVRTITPPLSLSLSRLCASPTVRTSLRSSIGKLLSTWIFGGDYSIDL